MNIINLNGDGDNKNSTNREWIKLNVGGTRFITTRTTLSKDTNSFFYRLIQDENDLQTDMVRNCYFIVFEN